MKNMVFIKMTITLLVASFITPLIGMETAQKKNIDVVLSLKDKIFDGNSIWQEETNHFKSIFNIEWPKDTKYYFVEKALYKGPGDSVIDWRVKVPGILKKDQAMLLFKRFPAYIPVSVVGELEKNIKKIITYPAYPGLTITMFLDKSAQEVAQQTAEEQMIYAVVDVGNKIFVDKYFSGYSIDAVYAADFSKDKEAPILPKDKIDVIKSFASEVSSSSEAHIPKGSTWIFDTAWQRHFKIYANNQQAMDCVINDFDNSLFFSTVEQLRNGGLVAYRENVMIALGNKSKEMLAKKKVLNKPQKNVPVLAATQPPALKLNIIASVTLGDRITDKLIRKDYIEANREIYEKFWGPGAYEKLQKDPVVYLVTKVDAKEVGYFDFDRPVPIEFDWTKEIPQSLAGRLSLGDRLFVFPPILSGSFVEKFANIKAMEFEQSVNPLLEGKDYLRLWSDHHAIKVSIYLDDSSKEKLAAEKTFWFWPKTIAGGLVGLAAIWAVYQKWMGNEVLPSVSSVVKKINEYTSLVFSRFFKPTNF